MSEVRYISSPVDMKRVYLSLHNVADTPFHIQGGGDILIHSRRCSDQRILVLCFDCEPRSVIGPCCDLDQSQAQDKAIVNNCGRVRRVRTHLLEK